MKKRYKVVLNIDIADPDKPYPAGGSYTHLNRIDGVVRKLIWSVDAYPGSEMAKVTLDKVIDKGEIE